MGKSIIILIFFFSGISFSQNLEEAIYTAAETFISNKNDASLKLLNQQESSFKTHVKTKDEQLALVFLQCHKGYYLDEHSKLKEAISTYEDALKRFNSNELSKFSDFDIIESCLKPLGNLYTKTGDYTNAVSTINQYIFLAEKNKNTKHQISGAINLAKLYQTLNKHETVLKIVDDAFKFSNINSHQKALLQNIRTNSLAALNNYEAASLLNNTSTSLNFEKYKNNYLIELQKGNYPEALNAFNKAHEYLSEINLSVRDLAKFYVEKAQLYHLLKQPNDALKSLQQAIKILLPNFNGKGLPNKKDLYSENTFINIFDLHASIQTNPEKALESYDLSFYVSDLLQETWTSQETKIFNEASNRIRSEHCIDILFNIYKQTKKKSLLFEAFQYSENNKASVIKDMNLKKLRLQQFPNDSLLAKEFHLLKTQEYYTGLLIKEQLGANKASAVNHLSEKLSAISLQLKTLKIAISKKYPESNKAYTLESFQSKLAKDEAVLVAYFFGKNTLYQFVISEKDIDIESIRLTEEIKKKIISFIHLFDDSSIINNDIINYTNQAFTIFKLLNFNKLSTHKNVVIIPDGLLNFIPFEALLTSKTTTTSYSKMPFVVKSQNIIYNSSVTFYLTENQERKSKDLLGFFPVFENTNQKLTYSVNEAHAIEKEMPSNLFMNIKASKQNFIENAGNYSILHLSTHASSGDFVNPANISFYNDTLFLNELYSLDLKPDLVVLSACETGIGKLYKGEGAMSIARGFQYAGADNLLFSLWQINDLSTSQIIQSFYENYNKSESAFVANNNSKIAYLENEAISNEKKSPYYWSAFVYYGTLDKAKPNNMIFYIIFGTSILLIIVFLFFKFEQHVRNTRKISS
ncbi:CHAT domain-containing protein [Confluentibacter flavum]|uniref:CHAT domain-containing protein n=1 Tax=Confluentibacter flavum TaxID=1909700 RepID=A0A2N3HPB9_9FLAO|nr:CHAT domain-containing tetratricopeptide repeat protein [Confluentibacter flavum]PKQ46833.1 CHAT domain-containing protein [Confluentibacter flavum]